MKPPWPPDVAPAARRRRRVFLGSIGMAVGLMGVAAMTANSATTGGVLSATRSSAAAAAAASPSPAPENGCSLTLGEHVVMLSVERAMALTDLAGGDQNAALPAAVTAMKVAAQWPEQAADSGQVALALRGYRPGALACTGTVGYLPREAMGADGLVPTADAMWTAVQRVFGWLPAGGFAPGGVQSGHTVGSSHYEGRAIDFFYRPITAKTIQHGWVLSQWLMAHAAQLKIAAVVFDARSWTPGDWSHRLWTPYTAPEGPTTDPSLMHYDHVHVNVQHFR